VGTLDQLVGLSDDLGKLDGFVEQVTKKLANYLGEVLENQRDKISENLLANGDVLDEERKLVELEKDPDFAAMMRVQEYWVNLLYREDLFGKRAPEQRAAMAERMLNVKLTVADGLNMFGDKPEDVPITHDLMKLARGA
ncbi:hypothetical protein QYM36_012782, partial [Artemia franciscana]